MWFSYPNDENWIAVDIARVKEVQKLNREGVKPEYLKIEVESSKDIPAKVLDYENVVGQDSLTRLDNKNNRNKNNNRNKKNRPKGPNPNAQLSGDNPRSQQQVQQNQPRPANSQPKPGPDGAASAIPQGERPAGQSRNNKRRKNYRNNNNRERPSE